MNIKKLLFGNNKKRKHSNYAYNARDKKNTALEHNLMSEMNINSEISWGYVKVFIFIVAPIFMMIASFEPVLAAALGFAVSGISFFIVKQKTLDFCKYDGKTDIKLALLPFLIITIAIIFGGVLKPFRIIGGE